MKKTSGNIIILHIHIDDMMNSSWDMVQNGRMGRQTDRQTDRQIDGQKKWCIEVGASPKNLVTAFGWMC